jgi:Ni,Fe-hydrogenase III large subunit/Ni,Fe-hydrogenase III component G
MTTTSPPDALAGGEPVGHHRTAHQITRFELSERTTALLENGFRLALAAAHDDDDALRVVYVFTGEADQRVELHVPLDREHPHLPSMARISFPAGRFEREMHDLFGIVAVDHPLPRRLVRHPHWPKGWYPLRRDAEDPPEFGAVEGPFAFRAVEGPGVYEIPVGPVHGSIGEPAHFRLSVVGETIPNVKGRLWFAHKGIEKLFDGRGPGDGVELAERISGDTAVGHGLAYCLAVEDALGIDVPADARRIRAILLELERLYNHVSDIGMLCDEAGHGILNIHAHRVRERLLRQNAEITGHRLLRGAIHIGGASVRGMPDAEALKEIGADMAEIVALAVGHGVVRDRFAGTAALSRQQALGLGALGPVARASGVSVDARAAHPFLDLGSAFTVHTETDGDVLSRFLVRAKEIPTSIALITSLLEDESDVPFEPIEPRTGDIRSGVGIAEGWRGTITHRVELGAGKRLGRVKIVDPSFFNAPALPVALTDTVVPDLPLAVRSFNLSIAGNDL